jgi:hypothetical protein
VLDRYLENRIVAAPGGFRLAYDPATTESFSALSGRDYNLFSLAAQIDSRFLMMQGRESPFLDRSAIERGRAARADFWLVDTVVGGHPPSLMTPDQALLILGFLTAV